MHLLSPELPEGKTVGQKAKGVLSDGGDIAYGLIMLLVVGTGVAWGWSVLKRRVPAFQNAPGPGTVLFDRFGAPIQ